MWNRKTVLTFADIFDDLCINTCLFLHFAKRCLRIFLPSLDSSLWQYPPFVLVLIILVQKKDLTSKNHHTAAARCFYHCNSSCRLVCL